MVAHNESDRVRAQVDTSTHEDARSTSPVGISIPQLRAQIRGQVISPKDPEYDTARTNFYGGLEFHPAAIARPVEAADIVRIIHHARTSGAEIAVRSGGHSFAGHSLTNGGIVIDLREMKDLDIDLENRTAWAGTGLTAGEYTTATGEFGLATGFGDTGSVGIGGITLGGGIGFLVRKYGMTIDNLLAAEVVTADGQILLAKADHHPDLFWALRGGGGNFGVVTRFNFRLQDVRNVMGGMLILPAAPEIIESFVAEAATAPDELSTIINVMPAPPMPFLPPEAHGKMVIFALMTYVGEAADGQQVFDPFRKMAKPLADMIRPIRYAEMFSGEEGEEEYHPTAVAHNMHLEHVDRSTAQTMIDYLMSSNSPMRAAQIRPLGGAMARVPEDATAYPYRQVPLMLNLVSFYTDPEDRMVKENWLADFARDIDQGVPGVYSNFLGDEGADRLHQAYPAKTWGRLAEIKTRYDPTNLFHRNHNIPPITDR